MYLLMMNRRLAQHVKTMTSKDMKKGAAVGALSCNGGVILMESSNGRPRGIQRGG